MTVRALRAWPAIGLTLAVLAGTAACTGPSPADDPVSAVTRSLGAVPIPTAPSAQSTESASVGKPAVLAIGGRVNATVGTMRVLATALGPEQVVTAPPSGTAAAAPPLATRAVITLTFSTSAGELALDTGQLSSRNETGRLIRLTAAGPSRVRVTAGHPAILKVAGTWASGAAQITWSVAARPLAIWTFNIELD